MKILISKLQTKYITNNNFLFIYLQDNIHITNYKNTNTKRSLDKIFSSC